MTRKSETANPGRSASDAHTRDFVLKGPLFKAISSTTERPVLLVDDIDRAGPAFETYLAEFLERQALEVPGWGIVRAIMAPTVVITATGPVAGSLAAESQYLWLDYPDHEREKEIVHARVPALSRTVAGQICNVVGATREARFRCRPGIGETIDWASALVALRRATLDEDTVHETIGCLLKHPADIARFRRERFFERVAEQRLDVAV